MVNLQNRSYEQELLDADGIPFKDIRKTMQELNSINTLLGGHKITVEGARNLSAGKTQLHICEIGCGGGDNLKAISNHPAAGEFVYTGVDLKRECIQFAAEQYPELNADWICSDYQKTQFITKPDIIFSSLFCHHFTDEQLIEMLQWMDKNCSAGFFINDLQRNTVAYYLIKWLTALFSKSYLVKNDACLSVARSFVKKDWEKIFLESGLKNYSIRWKWAFRYLIIYKK
jgi:2-polyprenyl-3-methyl-5-hydroxy-6-metoxy-1,4-benzoquinol methylase